MEPRRNDATVPGCDLVKSGSVQIRFIFAVDRPAGLTVRVGCRQAPASRCSSPRPRLNTFSETRILPVLVKGQLRCVGLTVSIECQDGVDNRVEEIALALGEDLVALLPRRRKQTITLPRNANLGIQGRDLVEPDQLLKAFGADVDPFPDLGLQGRPLILGGNAAHDLVRQQKASRAIRHDDGALAIFEHRHEVHKAIVDTAVPEAPVRRRSLDDQAQPVVAEARRQHLSRHRLGQHRIGSAGPCVQQRQRKARQIGWRRPQSCGGKLRIGMRPARHRLAVAAKGVAAPCASLAGSGWTKLLLVMPKGSNYGLGDKFGKRLAVTLRSSWPHDRVAAARILELAAGHIFDDDGGGVGGRLSLEDIDKRRHRLVRRVAGKTTHRYSGRVI